MFAAHMSPFSFASGLWYLPEVKPTLLSPLNSACQLDDRQRRNLKAEQRMPGSLLEKSCAAQPVPFPPSPVTHCARCLRSAPPSRASTGRKSQAGGSQGISASVVGCSVCLSQYAKLHAYQWRGRCLHFSSRAVKGTLTEHPDRTLRGRSPSYTVCWEWLRPCRPCKVL